MNFINQASKGSNNVGTYMLTIAISLMSWIMGGIIANVLSIKLLGYDLAFLPTGVELNSLLFLMLLPFWFLLAAVMLCVKFLHKRPVLSVFTARETFSWKRFFTSFFVWGSVLAVFLALSIALGAPIDWNFKEDTFFILLLISVVMIPIQTTAEEVFFRGFLLQGFGHLFKKGWVAILLTGILFGTLHWANPEVAKIGDAVLAFYIGSGVFMGIMTVMDDGMELSMGYHAINNIFAALIITNDWQAFQTDALFMDHTPPAFGWDSILTLVILQPLLLLLFSRVYKWKNWKEKLF